MKRFILLSIIIFTIFSFKFKEEKYTSLHQEFQLSESMKRGAIIYQKKCARCHQENGEGKLKKYPLLAKSDFLRNKREESIRAIKFGLKGEIIVNDIPYNKKMPKSKLSNQQIADVMNYITNSWGNKNKNIFLEAEVKKISEN